MIANYHKRIQNNFMAHLKPNTWRIFISPKIARTPCTFESQYGQHQGLASENYFYHDIKQNTFVYLVQPQQKTFRPLVITKVFLKRSGLQRTWTSEAAEKPLKIPNDSKNLQVCRSGPIPIQFLSLCGCFETKINYLTFIILTNVHFGFQMVTEEKKSIRTIGSKS